MQICSLFPFYGQCLWDMTSLNYGYWLRAGEIAQSGKMSAIQSWRPNFVSWTHILKKKRWSRWRMSGEAELLLDHPRGTLGSSQRLSLKQQGVQHLILKLVTSPPHAPTHPQKHMHIHIINQSISIGIYTLPFLSWLLFVTIQALSLFDFLFSFYICTSFSI